MYTKYRKRLITSTLGEVVIGRVWIRTGEAAFHLGPEGLLKFWLIEIGRHFRGKEIMRIISFREKFRAHE